MVSASPTIGRVFGISLQLHWSFLLLLLAFLIISPSYFVLWVIIFVFVLMHEIAHSLTAKRYGIEVKKILLLPMGGASIIDFSKVKPEQEFKISVAGPISNIVAGAVFAVSLFFMPGGILSSGGVFHSALLWLAEVNMALGILNLIPGFPMDGGRILRAYLQERTDYFRATSVTVRISKIIVLLIVAVSVVLLFFANKSNSAYIELFFIYDIIIALFLYGGADAEMQWATLKQRLGNRKVQSAMTRYRRITKRNGIRADSAEADKLGKTDSPRIYTKKGVVYMISTSGKSAGKSVEVPSVKYGAPLTDALEEMRSSGSDVIAVIKGKSVAGTVSAQSIEKSMAVESK
jgi:Zn-dependent protease